MQVFGERYELIELIDEGGIGAVYRVRDRVLDREVALKRLLKLDDPQAQELARASLAREATILSSIQHPNIVTIFDVGFDHDGTYVVMELIEGKTLAQTVRRGPLTLKIFRELARQALDALVAAQALNILHRDLKPSNVMLRWLPSGAFQLKILDFGLAKFSQQPVLQTADQENAILGSIYFLAPEQFERRLVDGRADIYALGCIFYHALTKRYPFTGGNNNDVMQSHLKHRVQPIQELRRDLPPQVANWIMRLIERYPDDRPSTADEALNEMHSLLWSPSPANAPDVNQPDSEDPGLQLNPPKEVDFDRSPNTRSRSGSGLRDFGNGVVAALVLLAVIAGLTYIYLAGSWRNQVQVEAAVFAAAAIPSEVEERRVDLSNGWMKSLDPEGRPTKGFLGGQSRRAFTLLTGRSSVPEDRTKIFQTFEPVVLQAPGQKISMRFHLTFHRRELRETARFSYGFFDTVSALQGACFARIRLVPDDDGLIVEAGGAREGMGSPTMCDLFEGPMEVALTASKLPAGGGLDNSRGSHELTLGLERLADPPTALAVTLMWKNVNGDGIIVNRGILEDPERVINGIGFYFSEPDSKLTISDVEILQHNPVVEN